MFFEEKWGGVTQIDLLGSFAQSTSLVTRTVSDMSKYDYILFTLSEFVTDHIQPSGTLRSAISLLTLPYFRTNGAICFYATGSNGSMVEQKCTIGYVSDTSITQINTNSTNRTLYVYGIKSK